MDKPARKHTEKGLPARPENVTQGLPAAIYCRISRDREGTGLGVERQQADCHQLAERLGWQVVAVYVDNDISAYSGKPRPQYRAMLQAVREGRINGVLAWSTDRLHRRAVELEEFVTLAEQSGLQIQTVKAGTVDLSTPSGRMVARMLGAAAQAEVENTRDRIRRQKAQAASDGRYRGGPRPYGYARDGLRIIEAEAAVIRKATADVIAGRTLGAIARELNDQGHLTSAGSAWDYNRIRDVLTRPRNAGLVATGRPDRNHFEILGRARWPAIVDEETWRACHAILMDPKRKGHNGTEPRWLGGNIYLCSKCGDGTTMRQIPYGGPRAADGTRRRYYTCMAKSHLAIDVRRTDAFVRDVLVAMLRDPGVIEAMQPDDLELNADRERRRTLVLRLEQVENDYDAGLIDGRRLKAATDRANAEIAEIDARMASGLKRSVSTAVINSADPGRAFLDAPVDVQRAILKSLVTVEIQPVTFRGQKWHSGRVLITRSPALGLPEEPTTSPPGG